MPERNVPWPVWAVVVLVAALLGSPLLNHYLADEAAGDGAPSSLIEPVKLEVTVKQDGSEPAPSASTFDRGYKPPMVSRESSTLPLDGTVTSQRYLTRDDLAGLSDWELDVLRNGIYARHGRRFNRPDLQQYFDAQSWYRPVYGANAFDEGLLSPVERWNAEFIRQYQR